ncbi:rCG61277 [Rattus norvegicus]|uniref:RCG61277 n=1 Tax=Rattus norvegicus TaxID=10116 RepID=A6KE72_RAT|nr:rCG61277 [Rattus norvegicus]
MSVTGTGHVVYYKDTQQIFNII